jgi:nitrous oxide reductase
MADKMRDDRTRRINRRQMLGTTAALIGGAIASAGRSASAQEHSATASAAAPGGPNLKPPVVQVKGGTLRGLREGKTSSFLGIT